MHLTADNRPDGIGEEVPDLEVAGIDTFTGQAPAQDHDSGQDRHGSGAPSLQHGIHSIRGTSPPGGRLPNVTLFRVLWIGVALIFAGCGATQPSEPPSGGRVPAACIGLEVARCELALASLAEKQPGVTPSYVAISERSCDGPCAGAVWLGHLLVEFSDGRRPQTILITVDGDTVDWEPIESALSQVTPGSPRLAGPTTELALGHCGLGSGIDVDGSFWDPIGLIDPDAPDLINSATARFTLNSPDAAILVTERGAVVQLVRHKGPKHLFGCD